MQPNNVPRMGKGFRLDFYSRACSPQKQGPNGGEAALIFFLHWRKSLEKPEKPEKPENAPPYPY